MAMLLTLTLAAAAPPEKPNILYLVADDMCVPLPATPSPQPHSPTPGVRTSAATGTPS